MGTIQEVERYKTIQSLNSVYTLFSSVAVAGYTLHLSSLHEAVQFNGLSGMSKRLNFMIMKPQQSKRKRKIKKQKKFIKHEKFMSRHEDKAERSGGN